MSADLDMESQYETVFQFNRSKALPIEIICNFVLGIGFNIFLLMFFFLLFVV